MKLPLVCARLDGMVSSLLGSTAKNIRKIFDFVSSRECILFLDEFDVIAKLRDDKNELGELKRVVNSLIQNIDNLGGDTILIAATNHHELLDPAVWRRFSKVIRLDKPSEEEIISLVQIILAGINNNIMENTRKLELLASAFINFSFSSIKTVLLNVIKDTLINDTGTVNYSEIIKETYMYSNHNIVEEDFLNYLLRYKVTQEEIYDLGIPLRKIRKTRKKGKAGE
jgi:SpoVK/Ycf46/Vps4 family AAA+-type ATPase